MVTNDDSTWSPSASSVTPGPTATTTPAPSWPRISGGAKAMVPLVADRSLWHTPQAASLIITSPACGGATSICSTTTGWFNARQMTAWDFMGAIPGDS